MEKEEKRKEDEERHKAEKEREELEFLQRQEKVEKAITEMKERKAEETRQQEEERIQWEIEEKEQLQLEFQRIHEEITTIENEAKALKERKCYLVKESRQLKLRLSCTDLTEALPSDEDPGHPVYPSSVIHAELIVLVHRIHFNHAIISTQQYVVNTFIIEVI